MALDAVGSVMSRYDSDQLYPVFGFGGIPPGEHKTSHCFSISPGKEHIKGINEVLSAYRSIAPQVQMSGPTNFAPVFRKAIEIVDREDKPQQYYILYILTDGEIHDMKETVDCLVEISSRNLPISVIIVGVGNEDFANMVRLDGDEVAVASGAKDIVQFVKFNEVVKRSEPNQIKENIAAILLEEVPSQMVAFFAKK